MRTPVVALAILLALGCDSNKPSREQPASEKTQTTRVPVTASEKKQTTRVPLTDLTSTSGLGAVRAAFNAHKGEARFLTLLSPT